MNVGSQCALYDNETTNAELFTDLSGLVDESSLNGHVGSVVLQSLECIHISRLEGDQGAKQTLYKLTERSVLCNEVRLGVNFDHRSNITLDENINDTLGSNSALLLSGSGKSLFAENLDSILNISVSLDQCLFTIHHAKTCLCAQVSNHFCSNLCHFYILTLSLIDSARLMRSLQPQPRPYLRLPRWSARPACPQCRHQQSRKKSA